MNDPNLGLQQQVKSLKELVEKKIEQERRREELQKKYPWIRGEAVDGLIVIEGKP